MHRRQLVRRLGARAADGGAPLLVVARRLAADVAVGRRVDRGESPLRRAPRRVLGAADAVGLARGRRAAARLPMTVAVLDPLGEERRRGGEIARRALGGGQPPERHRLPRRARARAAALSRRRLARARGGGGRRAAVDEQLLEPQPRRAAAAALAVVVAGAAGAASAAAVDERARARRRAARAVPRRRRRRAGAAGGLAERAAAGESRGPRDDLLEELLAAARVKVRRRLWVRGEQCAARRVGERLGQVPRHHVLPERRRADEPDVGAGDLRHELLGGRRAAAGAVLVAQRVPHESDEQPLA